jgi:hypothetical protein
MKAGNSMSAVDETAHHWLNHKNEHVIGNEL